MRILCLMLSIIMISIVACQEAPEIITEIEEEVIITTDSSTLLCGHSLLTLDNSAINDDGSGRWLIPDNQIRDGGPGKDGIPSIDVPEFSNTAEIDFLTDQDLVIGVKVGNQVRAYPHPILDWHEIVNDKFTQQVDCEAYLTINYCPLTGTAMAWNRAINGRVTTFGVSGLLYNTNLIPYDRATGSNWSQMRLDCVEGALQGQRAETYPLFETSWKTWKEMYPMAQVMNDETGFNRSYGNYPYRDYKTSESLIFPVNVIDDRLPKKERVLGVIVEGEAKVYRFESFDQIANEEIELIKDNVNGQDIILLGDPVANFMIAYQSTTSDGTQLEFLPIQKEGEIVMQDTEGNQWNIFGEAVTGQRVGERLLPTRSYIGYFFSWGAFYPNVEIY